jgi:formate-dependent nitrite reductase membrane component NrfD
MNGLLSFAALHGHDWMWVLPLGIATLGLMAWTLIDCVKNEKSSLTTWTWVLIILTFQLFGPLAYLLFRRPERIKKLGR